MWVLFDFLVGTMCLISVWLGGHQTTNTISTHVERDRLPAPQGFLKCKFELYLKQPLTPPQCKIIIAYKTSNHRLAIETKRWSTIPISRDNKLCHFVLIMQWK